MTPTPRLDNASVEQLALAELDHYEELGGVHRPDLDRRTLDDIVAEVRELYRDIDLGRDDPPEEEWVGRWTNLDDVAASSGDERDWFEEGGSGFDRRVKAHLRAFGLYRQAVRRRRKLSSGFDFGQIMWVGDMGASKSVSAAEEAFVWFQRGHCFFHNGGFNFGRVVEGSDIYEIVARIPRYSVIGIDEAHTGLESGAAMTTGIRGFAILCAGLRKKGCKLLLMSAMARMVVRIVREMTSEVRRPFKMRADIQDHGFSVDYPAHSDPRNFVLGWEEWHGFPFRGTDIVEGRDRRTRDGLGKPERIATVRGESVRNAFLLTDSFRPVDTAHAQRYAGKAAMEAARAAAEGIGYTQEHYDIVEWLDNRLAQADCPAAFTTDAIALNVDMGARKVGHLMSGLFGDFEARGPKGDVVRARDSAGRWRTDVLRAAISDKFKFDEVAA